MTKFFLTDTEGPVLDMYEMLKMCGKEELYNQLKCNPYALEKVDMSLSELYTTAEEVIRKIDLKPGTKFVFKELKKMQFDVYATTDDPFLEKHSDILIRKINNEETLLNDFYPAKKIEMVNGRIKVREINGGKESIVEKLCREYDKGIVVADDDNDISFVIRAKNLRSRKVCDVLIIQDGENSIKIKPHVDYSVENLTGILPYARKIT